MKWLQRQNYSIILKLQLRDPIYKEPVYKEPEANQ